MIDLNRTRKELLALIQAPTPAGQDVSEPIPSGACARFSGHSPDELFSEVEIALSERVAPVQRTVVLRDLLLPLRNALGNACKHGNGGDAAKSIFLELVIAPQGVLVTVTDEGIGFDVAGTVCRFLGGEGYFRYEGEGFRNLHRATSVISYENGGRTLLLCFRCQASEAASRSASGGASPVAPATGEDVKENLCHAPWLQEYLSGEFPDFPRGTRLVSCRAYANPGLGKHPYRYVLRVERCGLGSTETRILSARLHSIETAAKADFEAATRLHLAHRLKGLRIPRPIALLAEEPPLVVYEFQPWMNLGEYFSCRPQTDALRQLAEKFGRGLARLHGSEVNFCGSGSVGFHETEAIMERAETELKSLASGEDLLARFYRSIELISTGSALAPIHGAFGWDSILYGTDGRFYLSGFENCRYSDPGFDLGGFAADLLCFMLASHDLGKFWPLLDAFLDAYNSKAGLSKSKESLGSYMACALLNRLKGAKSAGTGRFKQVLSALEVALPQHKAQFLNPQPV